MDSGALRVWRGAYYDGVTASRHEVTLYLERGALRAIGESSGEIRWPYDTIGVMEGGTQGEPVRVARRPDDGASLVIADPEFGPALELHLRRRIAGARRSVWRFVPAVLFVVAGLGATYVWGIPRLAARVAQEVPREWEESLGTRMVATLGRENLRCGGDARQAALEKIVTRLTADGRGGGYAYTITILRDSMVNALAAPGGSLVVFHGLLAAAESADEVAGVLAHEVQHVVQQHGTRGILREVPLRLLAAALIGDAGIASTASDLAMSLGSLRYQRNDERDADREGLRVLAASGISPRGLSDFLTRLDAGGSQSRPLVRYLSTHPSSASRLAMLAQVSGSASPTDPPLLSPAEWAALTAPCGTSQSE